MTLSTSQTKGIVWFSLQCLITSVLTIIIRMLSDTLSVFEILFFHNFFALLFVLCWMVIFKQFKMKTKKFNLHFWRAFLGIISLSISFYALTIIPLTEATAVSFTGPLVGSILAAIVFKEVLDKHKIISLLVGLLGVMVVLRPGIEIVKPGALMIVLVVCISSVIGLIIKVISRTESTVTQIFYLTLMMSIFSFPLMALFWKMPTYQEWQWLIALGALFAVNIVAVFNAFKHADISTISPFDFSRIVYMSILAYAVFGEIIDIWAAIGSAIIVAGTFYMHTTHKMKERQGLLNRVV